MTKREWVYVQRPVVYGIAGCECGNDDPDWSEWAGMLWCPRCQRDFTPRDQGLFGGPIPANGCRLMGISFDRINLATKEIERCGDAE